VVVRHALGPVLQIILRPLLKLLLTHGGAEVVDLALVQRFVLSLGGVHFHSTYGVNCHDKTLKWELIILFTKAWETVIYTCGEWSYVRASKKGRGEEKGGGKEEIRKNKRFL
jgi:hypothetical protein